MKRIIFVSTGRCGTTRLAEILSETFKNKDITVTHQMPYSRIANVYGNINYHFFNIEAVKSFLFSRITNKFSKKKIFITTDPLLSMIIPKKIYMNKDTLIIHIYRDPSSFAESIFKFSRKKRNSFIAHNFIPFWQPYLLPLENILSKNILKKYKRVAIKKQEYFNNTYTDSPNYLKISMESLFKNKEHLEQKISTLLGEVVHLNSDAFKIKSNTSL